MSEEDLRVDDEEDGVGSAVRILEERREASRVRQEDASRDTLTPIIKRQLQRYQNDSPASGGREEPEQQPITTRVSSARSSTSGRRRLLRRPSRRDSKNAREEEPLDDIRRRLKTVGVRKRRRSVATFDGGCGVFGSSELETTLERFARVEDSEAFEGPATPEKVMLPSGMEPVVVAAASDGSSEIDVERVDEDEPHPLRNFDDRLPLTPAKLSFDNMQFLDDFDIIDDILSNSVIADLLAENREGEADKENAEPEDQEKAEDGRRSLRLRSRVVEAPHQVPEDSETSAVDEDPADKEEEEALGESGEPLSDDLIRKLWNVRVKLEHEVPPQHQVEVLRLCSALTHKEKCEFERHAELREGRFSQKEDEIVRRNWRRFCEVHDLDITRQRFFKPRYYGRNFIRMPHERRRFVQFLANGLPWRTLHAVFTRFKGLYGYQITKNGNKRRYTEEEDAEIVKYMESEEYSKRRTEMLTTVLGRSYPAIYERYKRICKKREIAKATQPKKANKLVWTLELTAEFLKHLMDITISEDVGELKDAEIPKSVWLKLQSVMKLENADWSVFREHWRRFLHQQLFCPRPIYLHEIRIMLIEYFYAKGIAGAEDVSWPDIVRCFNGCTPRFLYATLPHTLRTALRSGGQVADVVEYLYREKVPVLKRSSFDNYLPRLAYRDGKLEVIDDFPPLRGK